MNRDEDSSKKNKWSRKGAAKGDVAGLASYFNSLGIAGSITAAAIPGTNVAIAVLAATSAAVGSVIGGASQ